MFAWEESPVKKKIRKSESKKKSIITVCNPCCGVSKDR